MLKSDIQQWIKDYEGNDEHDLDLTISLKDRAYMLLLEIVDEL